MTNILRPRLFLLALLPVVTLSTPARATVVWTAGFEKGDLSEWTSETNPTKTLSGATVRNNIVVSGERAYTGNNGCQVTVHPDDTFGTYVQDRVDVRHDSTLTAEGKDSYISGYYFLPEDAKVRNEIIFYETKVSFRNWMDLWIEPKTGGGTTVKFGIESQGATLGSVLVWTGDWQAGVWHQVAIHVHWSTDATKGLVDLWLDGQQVVTSYKHNTKFDTNDMIFQTGLHRVVVQQFVETIYFDDFIEADTRAEINIGASLTGGGSDGGTTDAAGDPVGPGGGQAGSGGGEAGASGMTGAAGSGAAGAETTGAAGSTGTGGTAAAGTPGAAGSSASGAAGKSGAGGTGGGRTQSSGGCAYAPATRPTTFGLVAVGVLLSVLVLANRWRRGSPRDIR